MVDRNLGVLEFAVRPLVPDTKLGDLADAAGNWTLMALAAGLSIEQRTEPIGDGFELFKIGLVQTGASDRLRPRCSGYRSRYAPQTGVERVWHAPWVAAGIARGFVEQATEKEAEAEQSNAH